MPIVYAETHLYHFVNNQDNAICRFSLVARRTFQSHILFHSLSQIYISKFYRRKPKCNPISTVYRIESIYRLKIS